MDILYIAIGIVLLYLGGEWVLNGALTSADRLNIPKVFSAVVVVGFGTSAPELFVTVNASLSGNSDIAVGNILGSNIANILLISGVGILLAPMMHRIKYIGLEVIFFVIASITPLAYGFLFGGIQPIHAYMMYGILAIYFIMAFRRKTETKIEDTPNISVLRTIVYLVAGLLLLVLGAESLINGAVGIALSLGISQAVIGLSIVAIGTSLPELATTLISARRNEGEMIIGNVLGSNIFNVLLILSTAGAMGGVDLPYELFYRDVFLGVILSLIFVVIIYLRWLRRPVGIISLIAYGLYIYSLDL